VTPDDVRAVAVPVLAHRVMLGGAGRAADETAGDVIADLVAQTPTPM